MTDISTHPLLKQAYNLCIAIEACGAGQEITHAVTLASDLMLEAEFYDKCRTEWNTANLTSLSVRASK